MESFPAGNGLRRVVWSHVAQILSKLGLRDRVQVVLYALHPDALTKGHALRH